MAEQGEFRDKSRLDDTKIYFLDRDDFCRR